MLGNVVQTRSDLVAITREIQNENCWIVKDPLRLNYFCYTDKAYFVLRGLISRTSPDVLAARYESRFGTPLSDDQFKSYLLQFARDQLIGFGNGQDAARLSAHAQTTKSRQRRQLFANPLAIRLPGWKFTPIFERLQWLAEKLVRPLFLITVLAFAVVALVIVGANWSEFRGRLPSAQAFFEQQNFLLILLCLGGTKILHELGHALACRRWGAECHEIGLMFLLFTPCLYCDVSDAWMIQSKWRRIAIAAAGMLVEILIASLATLVWWYSEPGWLNNVSLNLMVICGLNTVLFNGNPFLRFDGYFILSDLWGIPNLWNRSRNQLKQWTDRWIFGIVDSEDDDLGQRNILLLYAVLSIAYRLFLITVIFFLVVNLLNAFRFELIAILFIVLFATVFVVLPAVRFGRRSIAMSYHGRISKSRFFLIWAVIILLVGLFFFAPLPHSISVPGYLEYANVERVYVKTRGLLKSSLAYGEEVETGQTIFELQNSELEMSLISLQGDIQKNQVRLERLEAIRAWNQKAGDEIPSQVEKIQSLKKRLVNLESRVADLKVKANNTGQLIVPFQTQTELTSNRTDQLPYWIHEPLTPRNLGAWFEKGQMVALIGKSKKMKAYALLRQETIDLIRAEQTARIMIADSPNRMVDGLVEEVSLLNQDQLPEDVSLFLSNNFASELQRGELESGKLYLARIAIADDFQASQFEMGKIRVRVANSTLATRCSRYLKRTFASLFE